MTRKKFSKEEKKQMRKEQRQKDALHSYRCRGFKNFLFWLTGVLSSVVLIISALFIGVAVVPVRVYLGDNADGIVSYDVSSKSLINAFLKANTYDMSDFPVVADALDDLIKGANLDEYVEIDVEKIKTLKFDETFSTELQSCIKVVATLESFGGKEVIGDIGNLEILNEWEEVQVENLPTTDVDGNIAKDEESGELTSNPKLYYYYHVETEGASLMATRFAEGKGEWRRAFDDNGNRVPESVGQQLYYANISQVPILDIVDLIDETLGRLKLTDLLSTFGGAELGDTSLIGNILGDKTISQIGEITAEDISLTAILPYEGNEQLYKMLLQASNADVQDWDDAEEVKQVAEGLDVNSLGGLDFNKVSIAMFIEEGATLNLILDAVNGEIRDYNSKLKPGQTPKQEIASASKITIEHLSSLNVVYVKLDTVLPVDAKDEHNNLVNQTLYSILSDMLNKDAKSITVSDLSNIKFENITLNTVLPVDAEDGNGNLINKALYDVLVDALGGTKTADSIMISDLSNFKFDKIRLSTVMPKTDDNQALYRVLLDVINGDKLSTDANYVAEDKITLNHLSAFNFDGVKLNTVLPVDAVDKDGNKTNEGLYKILLDVVNAGKSELNKKTAQEITIADLSNFEMNNINLSTVLPYENADGEPTNTALYSILLDVVNGDSGVKTAKDLKLSDLTGFSYDNLHLITILDPVKNASLYNVLCDVVKVDKEELKLSHLSAFEVSKIHLKTVLGDKATGNVILDKLIEKDVEISSLATAINGLSLYEIYGQNCFVKVENGETDVARYRKQGNSYILDADGEYKISKSAGIWLFLCFDFVDEAIDNINLSTMGCRVKYTIGEATFNSLTEQGSGNNLSKQLTTATIRQLVDAGVLESANPTLYTFTLQDAVKVG